MKNEYTSNDLKRLEEKIDRLQRSVNKLEKKLCKTNGNQYFQVPLRGT